MHRHEGGCSCCGALTPPPSPSPHSCPLSVRVRQGETRPETRDVTDEVLKHATRQVDEGRHRYLARHLNTRSLSPLAPPAYRWRSTHGDDTAAQRHRLHGCSCRERHPYLSLSQATERGRKSRFSMNACYRGHKSRPGFIYTGSILMASYRLHSLTRLHRLRQHGSG